MSYILNDCDRDLKNELAKCESISTGAISSLKHPEVGVGELIRLPRLLAANADQIDEDQWVYHAIRTYRLLYIPNLYENLNFTDCEALKYETIRECLEQYIFPYGLSNGAFAVGIVVPQSKLPESISSELLELSPSKRITKFLVKFSEIPKLTSRLEKYLRDV